MGAGPELETARQLARELEQSLEAARTDACRAQHRREALQREAAQGRDKSRSLRQRRAELVEKIQGLEKQLLRSSNAFGGTARFAAAARAVPLRGNGAVVHTVSGMRPEQWAL